MTSDSAWLLIRQPTATTTFQTANLFQLAQLLLNIHIWVDAGLGPRPRCFHYLFPIMFFLTCSSSLQFSCSVNLFLWCDRYLFRDCPPWPFEFFLLIWLRDRIFKVLCLPCVITYLLQRQFIQAGLISNNISLRKNIS
jgi:hypothetical protein